MATTSLIRSWWAAWRCNTDPTMLADVQPFGRSVGKIAKPAAGALLDLAHTLERTSYGTPSSFWVERLCPQGISGRPCQPDGTDCSLHNYHVAVDIDPADNPHLHRRIHKTDPWPNIRLTRAQVDAIENIRNEQGEQEWRWLGWAIGDTMHFQINVAPNTLTNMTLIGDENMFVIKGDQGPNVEYWQRRLVRLGADLTFTGGPPHGIDSVYGDKTAAGVQQFVPGSDGLQIGPFEAEQLDAIAGPQGRPGPPGPQGPPGPTGPTGPATPLPETLTVTLPSVTIEGTVG